MYSAVVLDKHCAFRLYDRFLEFLRINDFEKRELIQDWRFVCHHMTMAFGDVPHEHFQLAKEKEKIILEFSEYGFWEDKVCALKVDYGKEYSSNKTPHITMACSERGKPVESNLIAEWKPFRPVTVWGTIQIIK